MAANRHEDVVAVAKEIRLLLDETQEVDLCRETHDSLCCISQMCTEKGANIKESIRAWARAANEEEKKAKAHEPESLHRQRVRAIEREQTSTWDSIGNAENERKSLERFRQELREKEEHLARKNSEIETLARKEMPRIVHELSLQAHISGIAWDYSNSHRAKGCLTNPKAGRGELFDIDPEKYSTPEIVNMLWDLMD